MIDSLGDRMKNYYENRSRISLLRRAYTLIRCDGKAFHTYTSKLERPFDVGLIEDMNQTAAYLCKNIMGAKFAYVQSDEISILLTDFETISTEAWFDNNLQKMCSVSSSMATSKFNQLRLVRACSTHFIDKDGYSHHRSISLPEIEKVKFAEFDSRVWQIPQKTEVENYFIFRQQDCVRNSISSVAQTLYSDRELHGKNGDQKQDMIFQKGINWNDLDAKLKRGRIIVKEVYDKDGTNRSRWVVIDPPVFTQERDFLSNLIPTM